MPAGTLDPGSATQSYVVLSPHFDDAAISAWHILASSHAVQVVNVFGGIPPPGVLTTLDRAGGALDSASRVRERRADDREALALAARAAVDLDLLDVQYRAHAIPDLRDAIDRNPSEWMSLVAGQGGLRMGAQELGEQLAPFLSVEAVIYAPAGIGGHPDHRDLGLFGFQLADEGWNVRLYADIVYLLASGLPSWLTGEDNPDADAVVQRALDALSAGPRRFVRHVVHLSDEEVRQKLEACERYETEFEPANRQLGGALRDPEVMRYEIYWTLDGSGSEARD